MKFELATFRSAHLAMGAAAYDEVLATVSALSFKDVVTKWHDSDDVGPQAALNEGFRTAFGRLGWSKEIEVFKVDDASQKGLWTMDFRKEFSTEAEQRIGIEVTFNHAEAMPWTVERLDLANEAESARPESRIDVGVVILPTEPLKSFSIKKFRDGKAVEEKGKVRNFKMDGAVGTYSRLRTLLPKMRNFVKVPLLIIALHPQDGGQAGAMDFIDMGTSRSGLVKKVP